MKHQRGLLNYIGAQLIAGYKFIIFSGIIAAACVATCHAETDKTATLDRDSQLLQLQEKLAEWERLKPAIQRLIDNEADLELLVNELSKLSDLPAKPKEATKGKVLGPAYSTIAADSFTSSAITEASKVTIDSPANMYAVHLASFVRQSNVMPSWLRYFARYHKILGAGQPLKVGFTKASVHYSRLIYGPYLNKKDAVAICQYMKSDNQYCAVVKYAGEQL
ncbi:hypothetical protein [Shewanella youngdeokensis]|uniref:SPOR domain-containing protein n=1 Tax=Shewanella youngdeokensis TaxID=2999068 RepID=A0ABZ0JZ74_9GAMM|nr:hypothetical protein RGE70_01880 [Shewanella sp. DAU334]